MEFRDGTQGNVVVEFDVDIVTDIDWLQAAGVLLIVGGFATAVAGFLTGTPILILIGVLVIFAAALFFAYEIIHEIITPLGGAGSALIVLAVGLVGGYFLWTESGRGKVRAAARVGRKARQGFWEAFKI